MCLDYVWILQRWLFHASALHNPKLQICSSVQWTHLLWHYLERRLSHRPFTSWKEQDQELRVQETHYKNRLLGSSIYSIWAPGGGWTPWRHEIVQRVKHDGKNDDAFHWRAHFGSGYSGIRSIHHRNLRGFLNADRCGGAACRPEAYSYHSSTQIRACYANEESTQIHWSLFWQWEQNHRSTLLPLTWY